MRGVFCFLVACFGILLQASPSGLVYIVLLGIWGLSPLLTLISGRVLFFLGSSFDLTVVCSVFSSLFKEGFIYFF